MYKTSVRNGFRLMALPSWSLQILVGLMRYKGCVHAANSEVAKCAIFATRNYLKSQEVRKSKSPLEQYSCRDVKVVLPIEARSRRTLHAPRIAPRARKLHS